jgi:hypothetical protein
MRKSLLAAVAITWSLWAPGTGAASVVHTCPGRFGQATGGVGRILSVRDITCVQAARFYRRHHGDQHVPISKGAVGHVGKFTCVVYQDLTPPGPSDTWVRIRCTHSRQAFRLEYAV